MGVKEEIVAAYGLMADTHKRPSVRALIITEKKGKLMVRAQ